MDKINKALIRILERICALLLMIITALTFAEVMGRYVLNTSISWSHEIILLLTIWMVWLGIPVGFAKWQHIKVTFFVQEEKRIGRFRFIWLHTILSFFYFLIVFFFAFPMMEAFVAMEFTSIEIPINTKFMASAVGGFLSIFVLFAKLLSLFKSG